MKRKKRLEKSIESLERAAIEHEIRRKEALEKKDVYLADYLGKEIESLKERKKNRQDKLNRK